MESKYKLYNTDGKTFFDFRSSPNSRCEGFTVTYLDDGSTVMSGDYDALIWSRYDKFDYGFPAIGTDLGYFEEKVYHGGSHQQIKEFSMEYALEQLKENTDFDDEEDRKKYETVINDLECAEDWEEHKFWQSMQDADYDSESLDIGKRYTSQFKFQYKILCEVSDQIIEAVKKYNDANAVNTENVKSEMENKNEIHN